MLEIVDVEANEESTVTRAKRLLEAGDPVLSWMIFTSLSVLGFVLAWFYGLAQKALDADPTHITLGIALFYVATSLHCLWRCTAIARETAAEQRLAAAVADSEGDPRGVPGRGAGGTDADASGGLVSDHVRSLVAKARLLGDGEKLDQTLLLRVLAQRLSGANAFGAFASDLVMKLGLFGTIVGFIMMLAPIAGLNADDQTAIKSSMSLMSEGMAVAMYTTLAGLVGSILIKIQYQFVEMATEALFAAAVALTEVHVVPALERRASVTR